MPASRKAWRIVAAVAVPIVLGSVITGIVLARKNSDSSDELRTVNGAKSQEESTALPTYTPSVSLAPSLSQHPSRIPSQIPSAQPTKLPSSRPSAIPSVHPSQRPSSAPTTAPTGLPSIFPSRVPSLHPSNVPTRTFEPTLVRVQENRRFRLRMYWEEGFFWQESQRERFWCVECTKCEILNFGDNGSGCDSEDDCQEGNQIWIRDCNSRGHVFQVQHVGVFDQVKVDGDNLCLQRTRRRYITVEECDSSNEQQFFLPLNEDRFELRPATEPNDCATQQHHPKSKEIVGLKNCEDARKDDTSYWELFPLDD